MNMKFDELLAAIQRLPREDIARLIEALRSAPTGAAYAVRESAATYQIEPHGEPMTLVTMALPDELAEQARRAGLLAGKSVEEIIRRALREHSEATISANLRPRQLVERNGYLVAERLPGEKPITTEEVKKILDDMEW